MLAFWYCAEFVKNSILRFLQIRICDNEGEDCPGAAFMTCTGGRCRAVSTNHVIPRPD